MESTKSLAALLLISSLLYSTAQAQVEEYVSLRTFDSDLNPVSVQYEVSSPGGSVAFGFTDADGFAPWSDFISNTIIDVVVGESPVAGGVALGQAFSDYIPPTPIYGGKSVFTRWLSMPLAEPVEIGRQRMQVPASSTVWRLSPINPVYPQANPPTSVRAYLAPLLNQREIDAYFAYNTCAPIAQHDIGVVLRSPGGDLGLNGMLLVMEVDGHGFDSQNLPEITAYYLHSGPPLPPGGSYVGLSAQLLGVQNNEAAFRITGPIPEGDHIIALSDSSQGSTPTGTISMQKIPITIGGQINSTSPPAAQPQCQPCQPTAGDFQYNWSCSWIPPKVSELGCPAASDWISKQQWYFKAQPVTCHGPEGAPGHVLHKGVKVSLSSTKSWSINLMGEVVGGGTTIGGGFDFASDETKSTETEVSQTYTTSTFTEGAHGCGQCQSWVIPGYLAEKTFKWWYDPWWDLWIDEALGYGDKCHYKKLTQSCQGELGLQDFKCDQTPL